MSSKGFPKGRKGGGSPPPLIEGKGGRPSVFERLGVRSRDGCGNSRAARSRSPPQGYSPPLVTKPTKMKKSGTIKDTLKRAGPPVSTKKKSKLSKGRAKKRSSSSSSSSEEGSRSSTTSSSSSGEESTSTTSEEGGGVSSSDSSVPSVKLRTTKDKKKNVKSGKKKIATVKKSKSSKGAAEGLVKKKSRRKEKDDDDEDEEGRRGSSRSSSGGRQQAPSHSMGSRGGGGGVLDLREKLNARSPSGYVGQQGSPSSAGGKGSKAGPGGMSYHHHHSQGQSSSYDYDRDRDSHHQQHVRGGEKVPTPKKRCLLPTPPGDPFTDHLEDQSKRRRIMSPPLSSQQPYESHQGRRVPGSGGNRNDPYSSERGRSPPGGGRRLPSNQDGGRRDYGNNRGEGPPPRNSPYKGGSGGHYQQNDRHPPQDFRSSGTTKERVAPLRAGDKGRSPHHHHPNPQDNYSGANSRRPPLLSIDTMRPSSSGSYGAGRSAPYDRPSQRYDPGPQPLLPHPDEKPPARQSLLPKSKEALAEWYQSDQKFSTTPKKPQPLLLLPTSASSTYSSHVDVDKWVDETVKVKGLLDTPPQALTSPPPSDSSKEATKPSVVPPPVPEASDLSDFSDDADSILNNELDEEEEKEDIISKKDEEEKDEIVKDEEKEKEVPLPSTESVKEDESSELVGGDDEKGDYLLQRIEGGDDEIFEAISDDEEDLLEGGVGGSGERENKLGRVGIVDALGVDWASLVVEEKKERRKEGEGSVRKRWSARNVLKDVLGGEDKKEEESGADVVIRVGLGEYSRALSSRRDYALRRHYLGLPQKKSAMCMGILENLGGGGICGKEGMMIEGTGELLRLSLALFKSATGIEEKNSRDDSAIAVNEPISN